MLQKILSILLYALFVVVSLYAIIVLYWLFLPLLLIFLTIGLWRVYQTKHMWNELLKQTPQTHKKRVHIASDDTIIDAEYEEIKTK